MADRFKRIDIQTANLDANLTDFPLYVHVDGDTDIGAVCQSDGTDIWFTASDGTTLLPFERESFAVAAGAATGDFWVQTDLATTGTHILLFYGTATGDLSSAAAVWDANHVAVWHMNDATTSTILDSTTNDYDGAKTAANQPIQAAGTIGYGQQFDGANDLIDVNALDAYFSGGAAVTVSCWAKWAATEANKGVVGYWGTNKLILCREGSGYPQFAIDTASGANTVTGAALNNDSAWHHYVGTYDKDAGSANVKLYINGASVGSPATATGTITNGDAFNIGSINNSTAGTYNLTGFIDEIRLSSIARTAAWIKFEYYNIANTDHELTWGAEQATFLRGGGPRLTLGLTLGG
jgi:hypothetical protein